MGIFLNPDNTNFQEAVNSKIYVDKTGMISELNHVIRTEQKYVCISRPRRFGKSMAANMLVAYYSRGCDSRELFKNYKIANDVSFEKHLNQYNVIHINIAEFVSENDCIEDMIADMKNQSYVALTYMTGILPIKKYGEHSALNMFIEISMTDTREYAEFTNGYGKSLDSKWRSTARIY